MWAFAWVAMSGVMERTSSRIEQAVLDRTAQNGFAIRNILVEGRENIDAQDLKAAIGLSWGDPVFGFDADAVRARIEALSWVRSARVERRLPDTVFVKITERTPLALWQNDGVLSLIDTGGKVLSQENLERFQTLPLVVGSGAPEGARTILDLIESTPPLRNRLAAAIRIGERRWDIKLTNGLVVKLPEQNVDLALRRIADSQSREGLLDRGLVAIDLREKDRMILRTATPEDTENSAATLARKDP